MLIKLENKLLQVTISSFGAELQSIIHKPHQLEYLWDGNAEYWKYRAPHLFPIVGRLKNDQYTIGSQKYHLSQHGFARNSEFEMIRQSTQSVTFALFENEKTLADYPYRFALKITYQLLDNCLKIYYQVINNNSQTMFFSIGAHPAFRCPFLGNETLEDYYLEFNTEESAPVYKLSNSSGLIYLADKAFFNQTKILPVKQNLFTESALIFKNLKSEQIQLKSKLNPHSITLNFKGFPYLGIWRKPEGCPFLCLEPWYGLADPPENYGDLSQKEGIQSLNAGEFFKCELALFFQ